MPGSSYSFPPPASMAGAGTARLRASRQLVPGAHDERLREAQRRRPASGTDGGVVARARRRSGAKGFSGDNALSVIAITGTPRPWQAAATSITSGE